jgi:hypothetical protein
VAIGKTPALGCSGPKTIRRHQAEQPSPGETHDQRDVFLPGLKHPVRGHRLGDLQHATYPSTRYEIRVVARDQHQQPVGCDFRDLKPEAWPHQRHLGWSVQPSDPLTPLVDSPLTAQRILPKDHSLRLRSIEIQAGQQDVSDRFLEQLSEIGQVEGFLVVGHTIGDPSKRLQELDQKGLSNFELYETRRFSGWMEDPSEVLSGGARWFCPTVPGSSNLITQVLEADRQERLGHLASRMSGQYQGRVSLDATTPTLVPGGLAIQGKSYLEGGNVLSGHRADGTPYALVGRDSLALTKYLLQNSSEDEISDQQVLQTVAQDLGLPAEQVFPIEQPATFHLDMRMTSLGPGKIGLQDSRKAAALHLELLEKSGVQGLERHKMTLELWAEQNADLEDLAERDLRAAGLEVHRVAGAFPDLKNSSRDAANFLNARHGTGPDGTRYTILMGTHPDLEQAYAQHLLHDLQVPIDRLYFLNPGDTEATLSGFGGLKCRTKVLGDLPPIQDSPVDADPPPSQLSLWP